MAEKVRRFHAWWAAAMLVFLVVVWAPEILREILDQRNGPEKYLTVESIAIGNTPVGRAIPMDVDRRIHQDFVATYSVQIRKFPSRQIVCVASDTVSYDAEAKPLRDVTLDWWANDGECGVLTFIGSGPGDYIVTTSWMIDRSHLGLPDARVGPIDSNPFTILSIPPEKAGEVVQEQRMLESAIEELRDEIRALKGE